jgi:hypothetical protein
VIVTVVDPADDDGDAPDGEIVKLLHVGGVAPAWFTPKELPAIVALAERDDVDVFWDHATVTDPEPLPLDGDTVSHEPFPAADHPPPWQPLGEPVTVTLCEPDDADGFHELGVIEKEEHVVDTPTVRLTSSMRNVVAFEKSLAAEK